MILLTFAFEVFEIVNLIEMGQLHIYLEVVAVFEDLECTDHQFLQKSVAYYALLWINFDHDILKVLLVVVFHYY